MFSLTAPSKLLQELREVGLWSQSRGSALVGLDVPGLCSSWVQDGGKRMKGWCRLAYEVVERCEIAATVPSGGRKSPYDGCRCLFTSAAVQQLDFCHELTAFSSHQQSPCSYSAMTQHEWTCNGLLPRIPCACREMSTQLIRGSPCGSTKGLVMSHKD